MNKEHQMRRNRPTVGTKVITLGLGIAAAILAVPQARAAYIIDFVQDNAGVTASGSGTLNLSGLGVGNTNSSRNPGMRAYYGYLETGVAGGGADFYNGTRFSGGYGNGIDTEHSPATSGTGFDVGFDNYYGLLLVPAGYVSGTSTAGTAFYSGATYGSLGLTNDTSTTYTLPSQNTLTIEVGDPSFFLPPPSPVPEPASLNALAAGLPGAGLARRVRPHPKL